MLVNCKKKKKEKEKKKKTRDKEGKGHNDKAQYGSNITRSKFEDFIRN